MTHSILSSHPGSMTPAFLALVLTVSGLSGRGSSIPKHQALNMAPALQERKKLQGYKVIYLPKKHKHILANMS